MNKFQTKVNLYLAKGIPGTFASTNPIVSLPYGVFAEKDVLIGGFCWPGTVEGTVLSKGSGKPLGFVVRELTNPIINFNDATQNVVPEGFNVSVQLRGDFFAETTTVATAGQKVFTNTTNGTIATGAAGSTIANHVETEYRVITDGGINEVIKISNW